MTAATEPSYTVVRDAAALQDACAALASVELVGLDTETTGLNPRRDRLRLLTLAANTAARPRCWVVDCCAIAPAPLFPVLQARRIVGHNLAFDLGFLRQHGFEPGLVGDTMLCSQLVHGPQGKGFHTLAACALREVSRELPKELQRSNWGGTLSAEQLAYAAEDARVLLPLWEKLTCELATAGLSTAAAVEHACLPAVAWMQSAGVPFALPAWLELAARAERAAEELAEQMEQYAPARLQPVLFGTAPRWGWESPRRVLEAFAHQGVTLYETHGGALARCPHPLAELLRRYRAASKLVGTYGRAWAGYVEGGRIYPHWRQLSAASGRMSCTEPNLQQVPRGAAYRA
jgi:DNA polymerase-1